MCEIKVQIPLRTVEEWEAGRRKPPEYIPRLKKYQIMYEQQFGKQNKKEHDDTVEVTVCDLRMSTQIVDLKSQFATSKMDWRIRWQKIIVN